MTHIEFGHARNDNPRPPITATVENGVVKRLKIEEEAINPWTHAEISELLRSVGITIKSFLIPFPKDIPVNKIRWSLIPGEYEVEAIEGGLALPETAFTYTAKD